MKAKGRRNFTISAVAVGIALLLFFIKAFGVIKAPDIQCNRRHTSSSIPPKNPQSAQDFFELGNYNYDIGNCSEAITDYRITLQIDPTFAQAYNNRAYTNMRLRKYKEALSDLDKAISIDPNYINALMNRADLYNYYYAFNREKAIADYDRVISIGIDQDKSRSVCGHRAMAQTHHFIPLAILNAISGKSCK